MPVDMHKHDCLAASVVLCRSAKLTLRAKQDGAALFSGSKGHWRQQFSFALCSAGSKAPSGQTGQQEAQMQDTRTFLEKHSLELQMHPFTLAFKSEGKPTAVSATETLSVSRVRQRRPAVESRQAHHHLQQRLPARIYRSQPPATSCNRQGILQALQVPQS